MSVGELRGGRGLNPHPTETDGGLGGVCCQPSAVVSGDGVPVCECGETVLRVDGLVGD